MQEKLQDDQVCVETLKKENTELDPSIKTKIEAKIKSKFEIDLFSSSDEFADEIAARKLIVTTVSQIRNILRDNSLLFQHNIEYGFFRNLIGGSFLAFIVSVIIIVLSYFNNDVNTRNIGFILAGTYFLPIILSKFIIKKYGKYYAKILFEQFLTV